MQEKKPTDSVEPLFEVGVRIDSNGQVVSFCSGALDAAQAEQVAAKLLALAESAREEARRAFF